jgi:HEPN domain-containing protein
MPNRHHDWFKQALSDLKHSQNAREDGDDDWACFAAQQAAEKAVQALAEFAGAEFWGHAITKLLEDLKAQYEIPQAYFDDARLLDKFYIPTRYPNGFDTGAPKDYFTQKDAETGYDAAQRLIQFCEGQISRPREDQAGTGNAG